MHIAREEKLAQLDRILHCRTLHGSENLKAFVRFVVDQSIENQEGQLKEYVIATEVFGRASDFDPRVDSVVRVQAGRLRTKLHEYYGTEGKDDGIIIDLPKGQYTPVFSYAQKKDEREVNGEAPATNAISSLPNAAPAVIGRADGYLLDTMTATAPRGVAQAPRLGALSLAQSRRWQMATLALA